MGETIFGSSTAEKQLPVAFGSADAPDESLWLTSTWSAKSACVCAQHLHHAMPQDCPCQDENHAKIIILWKSSGVKFMEAKATLLATDPSAVAWGAQENSAVITFGYAAVERNSAVCRPAFEALLKYIADGIAMWQKVGDSRGDLHAYFWDLAQHDMTFAGLVGAEVHGLQVQETAALALAAHAGLDVAALGKLSESLSSAGAKDAFKKANVNGSTPESIAAALDAHLKTLNTPPSAGNSSPQT